MGLKQSKQEQVVTPTTSADETRENIWEPIDGAEQHKHDDSSSGNSEEEGK